VDLFWHPSVDGLCLARRYVKFRADQIEPGGFLSRVNVWFCLRLRSGIILRLRSGKKGQKLTEHEVALVSALESIICSNQSPLMFPGGDQ
jgi:hypothetical protein